MNVKHILCPFDFSPSSEAALALASSLARDNNAELHLVHVYDEPFAYTPEPVSACHSGENEPKIQMLGKWMPLRRPSSLVMEYRLPADGYASVDLYSATGEKVGMLDQGQKWVVVLALIRRIGRQV